MRYDLLRYDLMIYFFKFKIKNSKKLNAFAVGHNASC
jgi:hypothetical protein